MARQCERCGKRPVRKGYRFCTYCIAVLRREMKAAHYLTPRPRTRHHLEGECVGDFEFTGDFQDDGDNFALTLLHAWLGL